jgi:hypothetical protein
MQSRRVQLIGVCYSRSMTIRLNLNQFLERHAISTYRVVKETTGKLSPNTVYDLARRPAQRIDLQTVGQILTVLEGITGETVTINDLLEITPDDPGDALETPLPPLPDLAALTANAVKMAKTTARKGKPQGSSKPVTIRGPGPSVADIIREGRR